MYDFKVLIAKIIVICIFYRTSYLKWLFVCKIALIISILEKVTNRYNKRMQCKSQKGGNAVLIPKGRLHCDEFKLIRACFKRKFKWELFTSWSFHLQYCNWKIQGFAETFLKFLLFKFYGNIFLFISILLSISIINNILYTFPLALYILLQVNWLIRQV